MQVQPLPAVIRRLPTDGGYLQVRHAVGGGTRGCGGIPRPLQCGHGKPDGRPRTVSGFMFVRARRKQQGGQQHDARKQPEGSGRADKSHCYNSSHKQAFISG
ncbi:hypothetical protein [Prevotella heparinolytica]|uniref:hypothetical protein n=1 Tax=Prevotella heparinolytica TaxID=28113 RepID=UPI00104154D6|nr:hypothetical protein [Bacteroides heparinolyticus]